MKMEDMKIYLESRGFNVVYKYCCDDGSYDFIISKNNCKHHDVYKWPESQISFMKEMIEVFEQKFGKKPIGTLEGMVDLRDYKFTFNHKLAIKDVIFNDPATIVFWSDGSKTVVKCQDDDWYDPEKGLAMAISKKALGNKGNYCNEIKKWLPEEEPIIELDALCSMLNNLTTINSLALSDENEVLKSELIAVIHDTRRLIIKALEG